MTAPTGQGDGGTRPQTHTALLFPGQGAPARDWQGAVADSRPDLLLEARELLGGEDPFTHFGEGTEYDQPAIYCATVAAFEIARRPPADFYAGHSLGEIAALVCAGAIGEHDGLRLVVRRGALMADATAEAGGGAMLAVRASAEQITETVDLAQVWIANLNAPQQTVLSGASAAIDRIASDLSSGGVKTKRLAVSGAFHSPWMDAAARGLRLFLEELEVTEPVVPVISGRTARPFVDIRSEIPASVLEPVLWIDVVSALEGEGVGTFREIGPGKALTGLVRKCAGAAVRTAVSLVPEVANA